MSLLERSWFKCQTCGIECGIEALASWENPYTDKTETWDQCTTCARPCIECGEPTPIGTTGHDGHQECWSVYCHKLKKWVSTCPNCDECSHCPSLCHG